MHQQARGIDFQILAFDAERFAVGAHAITGPLAPDAQIGLPFRDAIQVFLSPPERHLVRIGDGLEDAGRGRSDANLTNDCVLIGSDCGGCHELAPYYFSTKFLSASTRPGQPWLYPWAKSCSCARPLWITFKCVPVFVGVSSHRTTVR